MTTITQNRANGHSQRILVWQLVWNDDSSAAENYSRFGGALASSSPDLYRRPGQLGLFQIDRNGGQREIMKGADLLPLLVDRVPYVVVKRGRPAGALIPMAHLNAMLRTNAFLERFRAVDHVSASPVYLPGFELAAPGYNRGEPGSRILYLGEKLEPADGMEVMTRFLDVMDFAENADRTNAVAGALTVLLRHHWTGGKPILLVTSSRSHGGKETVIDFMRGTTPIASISYQATEWALEVAAVGALRAKPEPGVLAIDNARVGVKDRYIHSSFFERFVTDPAPILGSTKTREHVVRINDLVVAISTNEGRTNEDIENRALPIHLTPLGDVLERTCAIGNPRYDFLPAHRLQILSELVGMVSRWKKEGMPLDHSATHSFTPWAKTIGGILQVSGFKGFLGNIRTRRHDPVRQGPALLAPNGFFANWH